MAEELTFTKFAELVLARTAEWEKEHGSAIFFPVRDLMADLVPNVDQHWPWQAADVLQKRGLVQAIIPFGGDAQVMLTPEGRIFVEQEQTAVIRDYRNSPQIVVVTGDGNQIAVGHGQAVQQRGAFSAEEAIELLDEAEERLRASDLPDGVRDDALADVETAKAQLKKEKPNLAIVKTTVEALRGVNAVADLADRLHGLLT
jgi:hypothetical protein